MTIQTAMCTLLVPNCPSDQTPTNTRVMIKELAVLNNYTLILSKVNQNLKLGPLC